MTRHPPARRDVIRRAALILSLIALLAAITVAWSLHGDNLVATLLPKRHDSLAIGAFIALYVASTILAIPVGAFSLYAGAWLGPWLALIVVSIASAIGAALAFALGRTVARPLVVRWIEERPRWRAIDRAIEHGGWRVVALTRLSLLLPYTVINYVCSITAIRFWPYFISSTLALIPGGLAYVLAGHAGRLSLEAAESPGQPGLPAWQWWAVGLGLISTVAISVHLAHLARSELKATIEIDP